MSRRIDLLPARMAAMNDRTLGRTGLKVSELSYGAASLGNIYREIDESEGIRSVQTAIDGGINYFDVAPLYGFTLAETRLGKALQGRRHEVILATKVCRDRFDVFDYSAQRVKESLDESLRRLQTDYIDVFQIHDVEFGSFEQIVEQTIPAALAQKALGKVRFVGITGLPVRYLRKVAQHIDIDTILSWGHYNLLEDELDRELTPLCRQRSIGLMSASPLLQGLLCDDPPPRWHRSPDSVKQAVPAMAQLCRAHGTDLATVALKYAVDYPHVATTVVGMSSPARVIRNLAALESVIPDGLLAQLLELARPVKNRMWFEGRAENNLLPADPGQWIPRAPDQTHTS